MTVKFDADAILSVVSHGITVQDLSGKLIYANPMAVKMIGYNSLPELLQADPKDMMQRFVVMDEAGKPLSYDKFPGRKAMQSGENEESILRFRSDGHNSDRWSLVKATPVMDQTGKVNSVVNTFYDLTEMKRSEVALRLIDRLSTALSTSLDYQAGLKQLAHAVVPTIADWCVIDILDENNNVQRLAVEHIDPKKVAIVKELQLRHPPNKNDDRGVMGVLKTGKAQLYPVITSDQIRLVVQDKEERKMLLALHFHSAAMLPLRSRGRTWGAITFAYSESTKTYNELDLATLEEIANRSALLLDNSRLFQEAQKMISEQTLTRLALEETNNTLKLALEMGKMNIWDWENIRQGQKWMTNFMNQVYVSDRGKVARTFQNVLRSFSPFEVEYRMLDDQKNVRWVYQKGQILLNSRGEPERMLGVLMDITDRQAAQDAVRQKDTMFRALFETSLAPIIIVDNKLKFTDFNKAATDLFGLNKSELAKKSLSDLTSQVKIGKFLKKGAWRGEMEIVKPFGDVRIIEYSATSEFIPNRNLMVLRDISDTREEERRREHLLTIASHELRTPLASIKAFVDIIRRELAAGKSKTEIENYLTKIDSKSVVLTELISDLLDLARIREKKLGLFYELVDFNKLLEDIIGDIQVTVPTHKIIRKGRLRKDIALDRNRINQVITNLVRNAAKYSPERSKVIVTVSHVGPNLNMSIQDFGMGIAVKDTRKIFSLFYRAGLTTQKKVQGLGVGLHIASEIVKAHGGKIWVESKINRGSIFYITLPLRPPVAK